MTSMPRIIIHNIINLYVCAVCCYRDTYICICLQCAFSKNAVGLPGMTGMKGERGWKGVSGPKGESGPTGSRGAMGDIGNMGQPGMPVSL